ncbi:MAG: tryptophan--tRNA ligase [Bacilli bacterium]|nr:tryptophan--tRNA ligase [Bacilli bacterium]
MGKIILTGDRPTGPLHIGHYIGSLSNRVKLQNEGNYDKMYVMIADSQALTDNFDNPKKIQDNLFEVAIDYLSVGIDPEKVSIFIQSEVDELTTLTYYYMNLVTVSRLQRNPTIKTEIKQRGFETSVPSGFLNYPVSQAADITAFHANVIPVGDDQLPLLEQTNEIVDTFNRIYGDTLTRCEAYLNENEVAQRLPGLDGNAKMSKSLGNCIYLKDDSETVKKKVMSMYTDPDHLKIEDPGKVEGNMVFLYLDVFATDDQIQKYSEFNSLSEMKSKYQEGGLGDVAIKNVLYEVLEEILTPIREKRKYYEENIDLVKEILKKGTEEAKKDASKTLNEVKKAIGIDYFE